MATRYRPVVSLRLATTQDAELLFQWVNDPLVRQMALRTAPIGRDEHQRWFARCLADPAARIWIVCDASGVPVAQVRFQPVDDDTEEVDLHTAPQTRGRGFGSAGLIAAIAEQVAAARGTRWVALIRPENLASQRTFLRAGFRLVGREVRNDVELLRMQYEPRAISRQLSPSRSIE